MLFILRQDKASTTVLKKVIINDLIQAMYHKVCHVFSMFFSR